MYSKFLSVFLHKEVLGEVFEDLKLRDGGMQMLELGMQMCNEHDLPGVLRS